MQGERDVGAAHAAQWCWAQRGRGARTAEAQGASLPALRRGQAQAPAGAGALAAEPSSQPQRGGTKLTEGRPGARGQRAQAQTLAPPPATPPVWPAQKPAASGTGPFYLAL